MTLTLDAQTATLLGVVVSVMGQIFAAYFQYKSRARIEDIHVATNGMKKQLEDQKYLDGARDQRTSDAGGAPIRTVDTMRPPPPQPTEPAPPAPPVEPPPVKTIAAGE